MTEQNKTVVKHSNDSDNKLLEMESQLQESKDLLFLARSEGYRNLQLPEKLRAPFHLHFSNLSQQTFKGSFLFLSVPFLLIIQSVLLDIGINQFLIAFTEALKTSFTHFSQFSDLPGVIRVYLLSGLVIFSLWFTQKQDFFAKRPQLYVSLFCSLILSLMAMSLTVNTSELLTHNLELVLIYTYFFVFVLLHIQIKFLIVSNVLACCFFLFFTISFSLSPDWKPLLTLVSSINLFGFMYAYLREHREIGRLLNLMEINIEKQQLQLLHEQIEEENELKARLSKFYAVMSGEKQLGVLATKILSFLVPEVGAQVGSIYVSENNQLKLIGQYGLSKESPKRELISLGEGLLGQAALNKNELQIDKTPESFQILQSGLGSIKNPSIFILPVLFDEDLMGVLEIASVKPLSSFHLAFLRATSRSIATALKALTSGK